MPTLNDLVAAEADVKRAESEIARLDDLLNRQIAKTEYEAERAGNFENDLDVVKETTIRIREALEPLAAIALWSDGRPDCSNDFIVDYNLHMHFTVEQIKAAREAHHDGRKPG